MTRGSAGRTALAGWLVLVASLAAAAAEPASPADSGSAQAGAPAVWTLGTRNGRQCLLRPDGRSFMILGISHVHRGSTAGNGEPASIDAIAEQLRGWGFNTVPARPWWDQFPFIVPLDRLVGDQQQRFEDVFDPAFKARLRAKVAAACAAARDNPRCIGYWWTDIPPWPLSARAKHGQHWVDYIRGLPPDAPGRRRYEEFLKSAGSHDDLAFLRLVARELYTETAALFEEYDPRRLLFGERYDTFNVPTEVLEEAARCVDVISVQPYEARFSESRYDAWHRLTGKPILISDWNLSFPTPDHPRTMWPQFATPAEAATAYEAYLSAAFSKPYLLGYFKCQYVDQVLPSGMLKQGLLPGDRGPPEHDFAARIAAIHGRLVQRLTAEGRWSP